MKTEFKLQYPVEFKGAKYETLSGRRPTVRDVRGFVKDLDKDSMGAMSKVLGNLFTVEEGVIESLDLVDYAPMQKWFQAFLDPMKNDSED